MKSLFLTGMCVMMGVFLMGNLVCAATIEEEQANVSHVLDGLHDAASKHEADRYFSLYAPDAIFLGTDATERWTLEQFKAWAVPYFNSGKGWTYTKKERFVYVSADMNTAWFDESLMNEKYGECRGSGVLIKVESAWKIVQYNLTFPVPNSLAEQITEMIKAETAAK